MREFLAERCVIPFAKAVHWTGAVACKAIYLRLIKLYDLLMDTHQARLFEAREAGEVRFRAMMRGELEKRP
jgi:hypothetical protein